MRRLAALVAVLIAATALAPAARAATAHHPRVSFTETQQVFMCTICHEPLNEARSPEAYQENAQLRQFISSGDSLAQIKRQMVAEYGTAVLADPPARGIGVLVFVIPAVVIALGLLVLAVTIPRWRRRAVTDGPATAMDGDATGPPGTLTDADARRLDAELARSD